MTIAECIDQVNSLKANRVPDEQKIRWLSEAEYMIWRDIICTHHRDAETPEAFEGFTEDVDTSTVLMAPAPFDILYRHYLQMQIDLVNMELAKYNNNSALFNSAFQQYASWYNRTHMPLAKAWHFKL